MFVYYGSGFQAYCEASSQDSSDLLMRSGRHIPLAEAAETSLVSVGYDAAAPVLVAAL